MDYPIPDRSNFQPNVEKTPDNDVLDIGWGEGKLSDGRPYRVEFWATEGISMLTFFLSTINLDSADNQILVRLLETDGVIEVLDRNQAHVEAVKVRDAAGNEMWSINIVLGDSDGSYLRDHTPMRRYTQPGRADSL